MAGRFSPDVRAEAMNLDIPRIDDPSAEKPIAGAIRISQVAIESRLRRLFTPSVSGQYKVSSEVVGLWKDKKKGKPRLHQLFQSCGYNVDRGYISHMSANPIIPTRHPRNK